MARKKLPKPMANRNWFPQPGDTLLPPHSSACWQRFAHPQRCFTAGQTKRQTPLGVDRRQAYSDGNGGLRKVTELVMQGRRRGIRRRLEELDILPGAPASA